LRLSSAPLRHRFTRETSSSTLGCAIGNFSVFACRAGAARVYAVEVEPILEVAREVVQTNGFAERVRFLSGRSTELDVPERARLWVSPVEDRTGHLHLLTTTDGALTRNRLSSYRSGKRLPKSEIALIG
jgi:hypothetical protein